MTLSLRTGFMARIGVATAAAVAVSVAPAAAATKQCGALKADSKTQVTKITTTSGTCLQARTAAKSFARTRTAPAGYTCRERAAGTLRKDVTCRKSGRVITFTVTRSFDPFPAPAMPST